jgi:hypothetical protein
MATTSPTRTQLRALRHLAMRGHGMCFRELRTELHSKALALGDMAQLRDLGLIRWTDQGWLVTDDGRVRAKVTA